MLRSRNLRALILSMAALVACGDDDGAPDATGGDAAVDAGAAVDAADARTEPDAGPVACAQPADPPCDGSDVFPPPMNEHAAGYFPGRKEMIVFGGNTAIPIECGFPDWSFLDTTWIFYDYANECGAWTQVAGPGPSARGRHAAAAGGDTFYVFGGRFRATGASGAYTVLDDLWAFDASTRTWREIETASGPSGRYNSSLAWDPEAERLYLFGGNAATSGAAPTPLDDLWVFDAATEAWREIEATDGPSARLWHASVFDTQRGRLVVYGGADEGAFSAETSYFADLWTFDPVTSTWTRHIQGGADDPPGRFWSQLVYDAGADRYVLFGGHDATSLGNLNDTWVFDPEADTFERLREGDTFNAPARGFCDFPPDFTIVDLASPERRNAGSFVYSESCGHSLLFAGKTDCGASNDLWRLDGDAWEVEFSSGTGEVCLRSGAADCTNLCN